MNRVSWILYPNSQFPYMYSIVLGGFGVMS